MPAAAIAALCLAVAAGDARAQDDAAEAPSGPDARFAKALADYPRDPEANIATILEIERAANGRQIPIEVQVYVADAYLRSGRVDAAERILRDVRGADPEGNWGVFANLGLGATRLMRGDAEGAESYFAEVADSPQESARLFGNLGMGHAALADGRPQDAKAAFDAAAANKVVDEQFRQAGKFGSATALYAEGDFAAAAEAFDELAASDPDGPIGLDARYAAARARLAAGDRSGATEALERMTASCPPEKRSRRAPRSLTNLDGRALGRAWLRNYREMSWFDAMGAQSTMLSIGGCDLARSTLRRIRTQPNAPLVQPVSAEGAGSQARTGAAAKPAAAPVAAARPAAEQSGVRWGTWAIAAIVLASLSLLLLRRGRSR